MKKERSPAPSVKKLDGWNSPIKARALTDSKGQIAGEDGAAARLGLNRTTLLSRMKKFGISAKQFC